jgi:hypothetical protein
VKNPSTVTTVSRSGLAAVDHLLEAVANGPADPSNR